MGTDDRETQEKMDENEPTHPSKLSVGDLATVTGLLCAKSDVGGTVVIKHSGMTCQVTRMFFDYEVGWRYVGKPVSPKDRAHVRNQAFTGHACGRGGPRLDATVYFSEHDVKGGALAP